MKALSNILLATILLTFQNSAFAADDSKKDPKNDFIEIAVTEKGFEPNIINAEPDKNIKLRITRKTDNTCATSVQIPSKKIKRKLPLNKPVVIKLGKSDRGEIRFGCGMNMMESALIYIK